MNNPTHFTHHPQQPTCDHPRNRKGIEIRPLPFLLVSLSALFFFHPIPALSQTTKTLTSPAPQRFTAPLPHPSQPNPPQTTQSLPLGGPAEVRSQWENIRGAEWARQALALENLAREFDSLEDRRGQLLKQIDNAKAGYQPGVLDPANVMKRRQIDRQLAQMQQVIQRERVIELQSGWTLAAIRRSQDQVRRAMGEAKPSAPDGIDSATLERLHSRWATALDALKNREPQKFAAALVGEALAPLAIRSQNRGDEILPEEFPAPGPGEIGAEIRRRWVQRQQQVDQLGIRQKELQEKIGQQEIEIKALRMELNRLRESVEQTTPEK